MKHLFTLIELLVVIAIIAILAAMLLPALNKARERGQAIHCMSTYSNLGKVLQMYVADFDGLIPPGQCGGLIWHKGGPLTNYIAEIEKNWNAVVGGKNGNTLSKFICPSYHSDEALFYTVGYNGYLKHYYIFEKGEVWRINSSQIRKPSAYGIFIETCCTNRDIESGEVSSSPFSQINRAIHGIHTFRHGGRATFCFADGHCEQNDWVWAHQRLSTGPFFHARPTTLK